MQSRNTATLKVWHMAHPETIAKYCDIFSQQVCTVQMMSQRLKEERREEIRIGEEAVMCFYPSQEATQLLNSSFRESQSFFVSAENKNMNTNTLLQ